MLVGMVLAVLFLIGWHVRVFGPTGHMTIFGGESGSFGVRFANELWDLMFSSKGIVAELWEVLPYFLVGILVAGYLRTFKIAVRLQASLRKYGVLSVFLASFVGIITPLCACGTVTTAMSLLFAGIPLAPVMALMVTSPLMSPSTYLLTLNDLGSEWTVIRTVAALAMGIFAGLVTHFVSKWGVFDKGNIFIEGAIVRGDFHDDDYPDERLRCNCRRSFGNRVAVRTGNNFFVFLAKSAEMLWVVGKYVLVGVAIGEVVERYMPSAWIYRFFGEKGALDIIWVTLASVPIFLHQISASSILYHIKGALNGTLDCGAALAFIVGGPVTAVPTMVLFWTFFKKRVFFLYMFVCLTGTLLIAYGFQLFLFVPGVDLGNPLLKGVSALTGGATTVIRKQSPNVRMVLDPGGKGIVALSTDDVDGLGGVVFDASPGRFAAAAADRFDNRHYVVNVANWLDQSVSCPAQKHILIYSFADGGDASALLGARTLAMLGKRGYVVKVASRKDSPLITAQMLADCSQLWIFFGSHDATGPSDAELHLITDFNAKGAALLIVPGAPIPGGDGALKANRLASRLGVSFAGAVENGEKVHVSVAENLIDRTYALLGKALNATK